MVGGTVIEAIPCVVGGEQRVWVNARDTRYSNECAIYVEASPAALSVSEGDAIWWQGGWAMWTPRNRPFSDHRLRRIGCSGVSRPNVQLLPGEVLLSCSQIGERQADGVLCYACGQIVGPDLQCRPKGEVIG